LGLEAKRLPILHKGTIIYSIYASIGKVSVLNIDATVNQAILGLSGLVEIDTDFLVYWLKHLEGSISLYSSSNTQLNLNADIVGNLPVLRPPLMEQKAISKFLHKKTIDISNSISYLETQLDLLKEKRSGLITQVVTKGLNPNIALKDSGIEHIGQIPEQWELKRTDWFLSVKKNQVLASDLGEEVFHYSIPSIRDYGDGEIEPSVDVESSKFQIDQPMLLVSKLNPRKGMVLIGKEREMPTICSSEFVPMIAEDCSLDWAYYLFLSDSTRQRLASVVQSATRSHQRARPEHVTSMWHAVPPIDEQREIAAYLERNLQTVNSIEDNIQSKIGKLKEYRVALISAAVTGQIDVRELGA
jgi:restriction endonuclease S subunit